MDKSLRPTFLGHPVYRCLIVSA